MHAITHARTLVWLAALLVAMDALATTVITCENESVMYAKTRSNVRAGPGTSHEIVGLLETVTTRAGNPSPIETRNEQIYDLDADRVAKFYSLAASSVERRRVSSRVGRNMPESIPVILLGQLAVDTGYQGRRLGSDLLVDAARRTHVTSALIGGVTPRCQVRRTPTRARAGPRPTRGSPR